MEKNAVRPGVSFSAFSIRDALSGLLTGLIIGILVIFLEVSFAAMVFSGDLEGLLSQGIGFFLLGALVMGLVLTFASSFVPVIPIPQDAPAAILGVVATTIGASLSVTDPEHVFGTVIAAMMLASLLTGSVFWLMGRLNLGRLVRFIPYPVVGGFLGGTGWLLVRGGLGVMTTTPLGAGLFDPGVLLRWLPGLILGIALFFVSRRYDHFAVMPGMLLGAILLFYLVYSLGSGSLASPGLDQWLLGPFPSGSLFQLPIPRVFSEGHFQVVLGNIIELGTIVIVSVISLLLNATGLELIAGRDSDLNRELQVTGIANILAGIGGSPPGYHTLSLSALAKRLGPDSRLVGLFSALVLVFTLFFGAGALSVFPKLIAGGLLIYLGFSFLFEWIYQSWSKLPKLDYFLIWLILITIAVVGFLQGVAVGIVIAVFLFVLEYSQVDVIRHAFTAANFQSNVMRPPLYEQLLRQKGGGIYALEMQGFIFFGSADRMLEQIRARIEEPELPRLRFLLLDFRLVTGIDSSAALSFSKLIQLAERREIQVVFTDLSPRFEDILGEDVLSKLRRCPNLDQGINWCERQMIDSFNEVGLVAKPKTVIRLIEENLSDEAEERDWLGMLMPCDERAPSKLASRLLQYLEPIEAEEGSCLIAENEEIRGLYFIEEGQLEVSISGGDGSTARTRLLESGTVFGEVDYYAKQKASARYVARCPSRFYFLSLENIERMENEDPQLAFALHHIIAGILSRKLIVASDTVRAMRK
jgi:SulP family sulfate permease